MKFEMQIEAGECMHEDVIFNMFKQFYNAIPKTTYTGKALEGMIDYIEYCIEHTEFKSPMEEIGALEQRYSHAMMELSEVQNKYNEYRKICEAELNTKDEMIIEKNSLLAMMETHTIDPKDLEILQLKAKLYEVMKGKV